MSHITELELIVKDLDALEAACKEHGVELRRGQLTFKRWRGVDPCDHAIVLPGSKDEYEIGVVRREDGWVLMADFSMMRRGLEVAVGPEAHNLLDTYSAEYATRLYQQDGFFVTRTRSEEGEIILEAER